MNMSIKQSVFTDCRVSVREALITFRKTLMVHTCNPLTYHLSRIPETLMSATWS